MMMPEPTPRQRAQAAWVAALEAAPEENAEAYFATLRGRTGQLPFPTSPMPLFVDAVDVRIFSEAVAVVHGALERAVSQFLEGRDFDGIVRVDEAVLELARFDGRERPALEVTRHDVLYDFTTREPKFIETNAGDPSGMGFVDRALEALSRLPALQAVASRVTLRGDLLSKSFAADLVRRHGVDVPDLRGRTSLCCDRASYVREDYEVLADLLAPEGWQVTVGDPREYEWQGGVLSLRGKPVSLLVRDAVDELIGPEFAQAGRRILAAYGRGQVRLTNPLRCAIGDNKAFYEVLTSEELAPPWDHSVSERLSRLVPWTRVVAPRFVTARGRRVDLADHAISCQRDLVLKPCNEYGGRGVVVGLEASEPEWRSAVERALAAPWTFVLQSYVPLPRHRFAACEPAGADFSERYFTLGLWVHGGQFRGTLVRASQRRVVNVHQGGALLPAMVAS